MSPRLTSAGRPPASVALRICRAVLICLVVVYALCLLGAFVPLFDLLNHFQPFIMIASIVLYACAKRTEAGEELAWFALIAAANVMLFLAPVLRLPTHVIGGPSGEQVKVMTFNFLYWQQRPGEVVSYIRSVSPDIVVLQEMTSWSKSRLEVDLASDYPARYFCERCDVAILSKRPLFNVRELTRRRDRENPPLLLASFRSGTRDIWLAGVHLQNPEAPFLQARQLATLSRELARVKGPLIVAGDLNLTPWSWSLNRLSNGLGLRRHTGILGTWSTSRAHLLPWFPIDHILSTSDIGLVSIERGARLGSDHLPVIATLVLPRN